LGNVDLIQLSAYFLDKARGNIHPVRNVINRNKGSKGWLIAAPHEISSDRSPYICTLQFVGEIAHCAVMSSGCILPIAIALDAACYPETKQAYSERLKI
jgi:hypothetical protein